MAAPAGLIVLECPDCGASREVGALPPGATIRCQICNGLLVRGQGDDTALSGGSTAMLEPIAGIWGHPFSEAFRERYVLDRMLGEGAMGIVYHGCQVVLDREVAVKFVKVVESATIERFKRETKLLAKLRHPGIVEVYDGATEQGFPFLALEYVQGRTLKELLTHRGQMAQEEALAILASIADALEYAHREGIVHRDLKLANILMASDTQPKIADFGLAKSLVGENDGRTHAGMILGTPAYMSPEQARGQPVTARCDLYSAGVMLFELVSGRLPFIAPDVFQIVTMQVQMPPPPLADLVDGPVDCVQEIIDVAMAKDPADRYPSARGMANAIRNQLAKLSEQRRSAGSTLATPYSPLGGEAHETGGHASPEPPASPGAPQSRTPAPRERARSGQHPAGGPAPAGAPDPTERTDQPPAGGASPARHSAGAHAAGTVSNISPAALDPAFPDRLPAAPIQAPPLVPGLQTMASPRDGAMQVLVPEGMFALGSSDGREDERPIKRVVIASFWIDTQAVTQRRYAQFQQETGARPAPFAKDPRVGAPDQPVVGLTYDEAMAYCRWAGGRLPTEAEFEKAARGGMAGKRYAWGNESPEGRAWFSGGTRMTAPSPVGRLPPNAFGLYDMAGNVWQWCLDYYSAEAYRQAVPQNPAGPRAGSERVLRGGCFSAFADQIRVAARWHAPPATSLVTVGFRVVRPATT